MENRRQVGKSWAYVQLYMGQKEVDAFQAYTIRNLDSKLSMGSDIEQYRLMSITEDPISSKQQHLDEMCFPVHFPSGKFGEFHPRGEKISPSEYIKSRLLNKDSRSRKDAQYVFYLLWHKEMRELSSGIYNLHHLFLPTLCHQRTQL